MIHFGTGTATLLSLMQEAGGDVIGLDWRVEIGPTWARLGQEWRCRGTSIPRFCSRTWRVRRGAGAILDAVGGRPGHVFNLGHGVHQETPVDHVRALVDIVHELSAR